jgi:hypothetical protein
MQYKFHWCPSRVLAATGLSKRMLDLLKKWLDSRGVRYVDDATRTEVDELIELNYPKLKVFHVDRILAEHGYHTSIQH